MVAPAPTAKVPSTAASTAVSPGPPAGERYTGTATLDAFQGAQRYNAALLGLFEHAVGRRLLEVGSGIGTFTGALRGRCELLVATDLDEGHLLRLRDRFAGDEVVQVRRLDLGDVPVAELRPLRLDSVFCSNVLEHVADDRGALVRLGAAVEPGAALLLFVPAHQRLFGSLDEALGHHRRYEEGPLRALLGATGWRVESLRHFNVVGALGWLVSGRIFRRREVGEGMIGLYDRFVAPLLALEGRLELPFGCSLAVVARRA